MLSENFNSSSVKTQQNQPEDSFDLNKTMQNLPNSDITNDPKKLKERITDLLKGDTEFSKMKQGDKILVVSAASGLFTAVLPLLAVGATLAVPGAIVGLALYFAAKVAVKTVQSGYKGLKWSAEKTVDGAKYTAEKVKDASTYAAGKVRDGAVYAKDKVKEGYEHSVDSLKRGTHLVNKRAKEKVSNVLTATADKLYRAAGNENYSDRIDNELVPDSPQKKKAQGIKEDFRAIFANGEDNSTLIKSILSGISSKIAEKIAGETYLDFRDYLPNQEVDRWKEQKRFVDNLDASSLHDLITKRMLDKSKYFRDSIFSEHYDEIKEVITKCKEDHILKGSLKMRNNMFEEGSARPSRSFSLPSFSLLGRKGSEQSNSLLRSSSLDSVRTDSTVSSEAELLNPAEHKKVKQSSGFFSRFKRNEPLKEATDIKYQAFSKPGTLSRQVGENTFYVAPPKPPRSNSPNSIGTVSTDAVSSSGSKDFATVDPNRLRRSSSSSCLTPKLTPVDLPELPRSASLTNLNGQSSFSEDVFSDPTVKQNLDSLSNSVSSLASNDSHHGTTSELSGNDDSTVFKSSSLSDHNGSDSGFNSPNSSAPSTPERQGPSVKKLLEQFDPLYKPNSLKSDVSVKGHTELNRQ